MNTSQKRAATILIIDDDTAVREAIRDILELIHLKTLSSKDGKTGLEKLEKNIDSIQLVMLDLSMPGLSGQEIFTSIRQLNPKLPVIFTTGHSKSVVHSIISEDQHVMYLKKPFSIESLISQVEKMLNK